MDSLLVQLMLQKLKLFETVLQKVAALFQHGYYLLGDDSQDNPLPQPPGSNWKVESGDIAIESIESGFKFKVSGNIEGTVFDYQVPTEALMSLALPMVVQWWAKSTWFGFRRKAWYFCLNRIVKAQNQESK